jgi:hypothetical protein
MVKKGSSKSEAENKLIETLHSLQKGTYQEIKDSKITFEESECPILNPLGIGLPRIRI